MVAVHIRKGFDQELDAVQAQLLRLGGLVEAALLEATDSLAARDPAMAEAVRAKDAAIDALEEQIQNDCARIIALESPAARDLRVVLTVMRIASALERAGDYAKNLAKRTGQLVEMQAVDGASDAIRRLAKAAVSMLSDALDAFVARDVARALEVRARDHAIDQLYNAIFRDFLARMMEDPRQISACMHLQFIAKNIERVGDHATSVAEQVIYLVTGNLPTDPRPKADPL